LIRAGLNIARLNFSHGNFDQHGEVITRIRAASEATGRARRDHGRPPRAQNETGNERFDEILEAGWHHGRMV
jgi:hypothetical protein